MWAAYYKTYFDVYFRHQELACLDKIRLEFHKLLKIWFKVISTDILMFRNFNFMFGGALQYSKSFLVCISKSWRGVSSYDPLVYTKGLFELKLRHTAFNSYKKAIFYTHYPGDSRAVKIAPIKK